MKMCVTVHVYTDVDKSFLILYNLYLLAGLDLIIHFYFFVVVVVVVVVLLFYFVGVSVVCCVVYCLFCINNIEHKIPLFLCSLLVSFNCTSLSYI